MADKQIKGIPLRQRQALTPAAFSKAEELQIWWQSVCKDPRFMDIVDAQKRRKRYANVIHPTQHGMNYVAGHNAGFDEALDGLFDVHLNQQTQDPHDDLTH